MRIDDLQATHHDTPPKIRIDRIDLLKARVRFPIVAGLLINIPARFPLIYDVSTALVALRRPGGI